MPMIDFDDIEIGDETTPFARTTGFAEWNRYAAVNDEFIPIHMDDEAGRRAGNEAGAFGMGNLRLSYVLNMLRDWAGDECEIRSLTVQYRKLNQKGDVLRAVGQVTGKERTGGVAVVHLKVDVLDQDGNSTTPGEATVALSGSWGEGDDG